MNALNQLEAAKRGAKYCKFALSHKLENWERKEYQAVLDENNNEISRLTAHINNNFDVFGVTV